MKSKAENTSKELALQYRRLGGKRLAVLDDNLVSTRQWEKDSPEAEAFWRDQIEPLPKRKKKDIEKFLPDINAR